METSLEDVPLDDLHATQEQSVEDLLNALLCEQVGTREDLSGLIDDVRELKCKVDDRLN